MRDVHVVEVLDSHANVFHEFSGLALVECLFLLYALKELTTEHTENETRCTLVNGARH